MSTLAIAEVWRPTVGFSNYEVSNLGRVRRSVAGVSGATLGRVLRLTSQPSGHWYVTMSHGGRVTKQRIHRMVLTTFVGPCPPGMEGCHNDGDPANNRLDNLRWDTPVANAADKKRHGTDSHPAYSRKGEEHPGSLLKEGDVREIRKRLADGESRTAVARDYGVNRTTVSDIGRGKTWRHCM